MLYIRELGPSSQLTPLGSTASAPCQMSLSIAGLKTCLWSRGSWGAEVGFEPKELILHPLAQAPGEETWFHPKRPGTCSRMKNWSPSLGDGVELTVPWGGGSGYTTSITCDSQWVTGCQECIFASSEKLAKWCLSWVCNNFRCIQIYLV